MKANRNIIILTMIKDEYPWILLTKININTILYKNDYIGNFRKDEIDNILYQLNLVIEYVIDMHNLFIDEILWADNDELTIDLYFKINYPDIILYD